MTAEATTVSEARIDNYPSRSAGSPAQFLQRLDPVTYARDSGGPVSAAQLAQYEEQGFFIIEDIFSNAQIDRLQKEQQRLWAAGRSLLRPAAKAGIPLHAAINTSIKHAKE